MSSIVNHPYHYTQYKVEVIKITSLLPACLSNIVKYLLRSPYKSREYEDLQKARKYWELYLENKTEEVRTVYTVEGRDKLFGLVNSLFDENTLTNKQRDLREMVWCVAQVAVYENDSVFLDLLYSYISKYKIGQNPLNSAYEIQKHFELAQLKAQKELEELIKSQKGCK